MSDEIYNSTYRPKTTNTRKNTTQMKVQGGKQTFNQIISVRKWKGFPGYLVCIADDPTQ